MGSLENQGDFHMLKSTAGRFGRGKHRKCAVAGKQCWVSFSGPCNGVLFGQNAVEWEHADVFMAKAICNKINKTQAHPVGKWNYCEDISMGQKWEWSKSIFLISDGWHVSFSGHMTPSSTYSSPCTNCLVREYSWEAPGSPPSSPLPDHWSHPQESCDGKKKTKNKKQLKLRSNQMGICI